MATLDRPRLRNLSYRRIRHQDADYVACEDPAGSFSGQVLIPALLFRTIFRHCDGETTLAEIQAKASQEMGVALPEADLQALLDQLEQAMVLDGPVFRKFAQNYAAEPVRPAALAGRSYPADPAALRAFLGRFFEDPRSSGPVTLANEQKSGLRAVLCPHIDFTRGGPTYTWAYRELVEKSDADTFVILGVAHQGTRNRFALTRKHFATPFGLVETDQQFVDQIVARTGLAPFEDELAHRTEHSIEFQAVLLQMLLGGRRPFRIVPILVGSFHDLMQDSRKPIEDPEVSRMVEAIRLAEAASDRKIAYIGAIDLCHVGPEFGDPSPVDDAHLAQIRNFDHTMLDRAASGDAAGWFDQAAEVNNRWRVCGLAATYTMLHVIGPAQGRLLRYDQAINPARTCCVSFASVAYETTTPSRNEM